MRVAIVVHRERPLALDLAARTADWLAAQGGTAVLLTDDADRIGHPECGVGAADLTRGTDACLSFGGDGTMLRAVDVASADGVPVLGVNCGQMGYLTEVEPADLDAALARLGSGAYAVEERTMLAVRVDSAGPAAGDWIALNETVVEKPRTGHTARLEVAINGRPFTTYAADGLVVATPTGSTAYSFSARGPIVSPRLRCLLLTPVSPHMLFDRALVLAADDELAITVNGDLGATMTVDGRELGALAPTDVVTCTASDTPARLISLAPRDFHQILKAKFGLADR